MLFWFVSFLCLPVWHHRAQSVWDHFRVGHDYMYISLALRKIQVFSIRRRVNFILEPSLCEVTWDWVVSYILCSNPQPPPKNGNHTGGTPDIEFCFTYKCAFWGFLKISCMLVILVQNLESLKSPIPKIPTMHCASWGFWIDTACYALKSPTPA